MRDRMLHIADAGGQKGRPAMTAALDAALAGTRAGLVERTSSGSYAIGGTDLTVQLAWKDDEPRPERDDLRAIAGFVADSIDRPEAGAEDLRIVHAALSGIAASVDTDGIRVAVFAPTPWEEAYAYAGDCPWHRSTREPWRRCLPRTYAPIDPDTEALLPNLVTATMFKRGITLRAFDWIGSRDPYRPGQGPEERFGGPEVPDPITALRAIGTLRVARTPPTDCGNGEGRRTWKT